MCVESIDNDNDANEPKIQIISTAVTKAPFPIAFPTTNDSPHESAGHPPHKFYARLIETMKMFQAPLNPSNLAVESRDYEDTIDLAKLRIGMLQLMYAMDDVTWDNCVVKNIRVTTFSQGFLNLLAQSA